MVKIYSSALEKHFEINRQVAHINGDASGPTFIIVSGIHGNEPSGIFAVKNMVSKIEPKEISGNIFALAGNLNALSLNERYATDDLNRLWHHENLKLKITKNTSQDIIEQRELYNIIQKIISKNRGPFFIIDLHTTSSKTIPFFTINNHQSTIDFCADFPMPKVTGIDDFVKGAFFTYMNKQGHVALGFEAGSHDDFDAIYHHEMFIYMALEKAGLISKKCRSGLLEATENTDLHDSSFYEIIERFHIEDGLPFQMKKGYKNFQQINKDELLAHYKGKEIRSSFDGNIFLPLYQKKGNDGFFIVVNQKT
ncbi:MAG: succinylglutamate desuccinylase/aspartoacylase family protein [Saprospiraceae bacterium]